MILVIGGPPGSGKTTVAERGAAARAYVLVSAGTKFRAMAKGRGLSLGAVGREARREIVARDKSERVRYQAIYGIDVRDTGIFDLVIDSRNRTPDAIVAMIGARVGG